MSLRQISSQMCRLQVRRLVLATGVILTPVQVITIEPSVIDEDDLPPGIPSTIVFNITNHGQSVMSVGDTVEAVVLSHSQVL